MTRSTNQHADLMAVLFELTMRRMIGRRVFGLGLATDQGKGTTSTTRRGLNQELGPIRRNKERAKVTDMGSGVVLSTEASNSMGLQQEAIPTTAIIRTRQDDLMDSKDNTASEPAIHDVWRMRISICPALSGCIVLKVMRTAAVGRLGVKRG